MSAIRKFSIAQIIGATLAVAIGLGMAFWLIDPRQLDPTQIGWLMHGDSAQHFLGWHFFRSDEWRFPFGLNPRYGMEMSNSIVYTDSIPLLAIPLKLISALLPKHFQYEGWWMLWCYAMQGLLGYLLAYRFSRNIWTGLIAAALFVLSPLLHARMMGHFALMGQWLLLLAFWLYTHPQWPSKRLAWTVLLCVTVTVHGYLFYMVFALWVAMLFRKRFDLEWERRLIWQEVVFSMSSVLMVMWLVGWFTISGGAAFKGGSYGQYAANLNALINPAWGSPFLPQMAEPIGFETFAYLGVGMLCLLLVAVIGLWRSGQLSDCLRRHRWLLMVLLGLSLLAISHKIRWAEVVLFEVPLPEKIHSKMEFIRASGRLLWPLHYALLLGGIVAVVRWLPSRWSITVLSVALLLQLVDLRPGYLMFKGYIRNEVDVSTAAFERPRSPFWEEAKGRYTEINFVPPVGSPPNYEFPALWIGDQFGSINAAYFARFRMSRSRAATPKLIQEITLGPPRTNVLYILTDPALRGQVNVGEKGLLEEIDGYLVFAPNWSP